MSDIRNSLSWMLRGAFFCRMLFSGRDHWMIGRVIPSSICHQSQWEKEKGKREQKQNMKGRWDYFKSSERKRCRKARLGRKRRFQNVTFQLFFGSFQGRFKNWYGSYHIILHVFHSNSSPINISKTFEPKTLSEEEKERKVVSSREKKGG